MVRACLSTVVAVAWFAVRGADGRSDSNNDARPDSQHSHHTKRSRGIKFAYFQILSRTIFFSFSFFLKETNATWGERKVDRIPGLFMLTRVLAIPRAN